MKVDGEWLKFQKFIRDAIIESYENTMKRKFKDDTSEIHLQKPWANDLSEGDYNNSYIEAENKINLEYIVGDGVLARGIEFFDIMRVTEKELYLYHVKDGFGQTTRDDCSQIRNGAYDIKHSLQDLYEELEGEENRETQRKNLRRVTPEGFKGWFQTKRITYVYAFRHPAKNYKNKAVKDKKMKNHLANAREFSASRIAMHEIVHTNLHLEECGVDFAICQIYRENEEVKDSKKVKTEPTS